MSRCVAICRNVPCFTSCRERRGDRGVIYARYLAFLLTSKCRRRSLCLIKIALPCLLDVSAFYGDPKVCAAARAPVVILVTTKKLTLCGMESCCSVVNSVILKLGPSKETKDYEDYLPQAVYEVSLAFAKRKYKKTKFISYITFCARSRFPLPSSPAPSR